ncbi:AMP-binding protein [Thauera humireducens]|uniref:AMP-binding protein n=1 Tax=Thauera humireducens TaxID=1134435 RepID=UPI003C731605
MQFTSGTTGHPKGATLSHHNILNNGYFVGEAIKLVPGDRLCIPVPLYHCFGMVMGNLGCPDPRRHHGHPAEAFEPLAVLETVAQEKCTGLYGVPTMFIAALDHPRFADFDLSQLAAPASWPAARADRGREAGDRQDEHGRG